MGTPRIPAAAYTPARRHTIAAIGDSLTHNFTLQVPPHLAWPERLAARLRDAGYGVRARNFAISGNTTTQMLTRIGELLAYDTPDVAIIFGGVNDPGSGINAATTQSNLEAMVRYLRNGCAGQVTGQANLPAYQRAGTRYLVTSDTSTTGGLATPTNASHATYAGTHSGPQIWEARSGLAGTAGWSRIQDVPSNEQSVTRLILVSPQFLNYTSGGDTVGSGHSGQGATYLAVNNAVSAAATAQSVVFADLYLYLQQRISDGYDTAASASWHVAGTNQHFNAYGWDLIAQFMLATISAQSGWLTALGAD